MNLQKLHLSAFALALGISGVAQAALYDRGGGLIYDDDLDITWLQDANYAQTSGHDADGLMTLTNAMNWAANLSYYDSVRNTTYTDWRMPTTIDQSCSGYNCTGSEMGHLYYLELSGTSLLELATAHDADYDLFENIQSSNFYWSGSMVELLAPAHWVFHFGNGDQYYNFPYQDLGGEYPMQNLYYIESYAWAVRDGDVAAASVPEAETWAMLLAGLGLVGAMSRRRNQPEV